MGTYISIPYVTRRSVYVEQSKPVTANTTTEVEALLKAEPLKEDVKDVVKEEPKEDVKEEPKEEVKIEAKEEVKIEAKEDVKEEPKVEAKNVVIEAEKVIPELLPKRLSIKIPSESDVLPDPSEKAVEVQRIPEFRGNMNSESHAIKKFNRRHRKHQN
jgi:hypothetical protein